jgi:hypothetical protein
MKFYNLKIGTKTKKGNWLSYIEKVISSTEDSQWKIQEYFQNKYYGFIVEVILIENIDLTPIDIKPVELNTVTKQSSKSVYRTIKDSESQLPSSCLERTELEISVREYNKKLDNFKRVAEEKIITERPYLTNLSIVVTDAYRGYFKYSGCFKDEIIKEIIEIGAIK